MVNATINRLNMQDEIDVSLLKVYLDQSRLAAYCSLIFSLYLAASFYQVTSGVRIIFWLFLVYIVSFYTIFTSMQFTNALPIYKVSAFRRRQHFLHFLSGLAWGAAILLLANTHHTVDAGYYRIAVAVAIMMAISSSSKAASLNGLISFIIGVSLLSLWGIIEHFSVLSWWFFGAIGLAGTSLYFGKVMSQFIQNQVEQGIVNSGYVEELRALNEKIKQTNEDFMKRNLEVQDIQTQLKHLASNDSLTGLYNRRYILERIEEKLPEIRRHQLQSCFVLMDIDHFKEVNDSYGHHVGDDVLKAVAVSLENGVRKGDIVARYGGEEFLIFLSMTDIEAAKVLVERLRAAIAQHEHTSKGEVFTVTASFGIAHHELLDSADRTIQRADAALYQAKKAGRNRLVVAQDVD